MNVHRSFIHNSPKRETLQMSLKNRMDKQIEEFPCYGILFSDKKNEILTHTTWVYTFVKSHLTIALKIYVFILP